LVDGEEKNRVPGQIFAAVADAWRARKLFKRLK
jgi:hypothetical protein